jgi:hypothetical protein
MSTEIGSSPHPGLVLAATTLASAMVLVDQSRAADAARDNAPLRHRLSVIPMGAQRQSGVLGRAPCLRWRARRSVGAPPCVHCWNHHVCRRLCMRRCSSDVLVTDPLPRDPGRRGAAMLPATVALVSSAFTGPQRGTALGTMGGIAAVAGAARSGHRRRADRHPGLALSVLGQRAARRRRCGPHRGGHPTREGTRSACAD